MLGVNIEKYIYLLLDIRNEDIFTFRYLLFFSYMYSFNFCLEVLKLKPVEFLKS